MLVGDDPASEIYVRNKLKSAGEAGLRADLERLPATASLDELLAVVERLNRSEAHDGILVQSPLPAAMGADAERRVFDVDPARTRTSTAFIPSTSAGWCRTARRSSPCTPSGVIELLERSNIADRRRARRRHRPQRHRRQADGAAAAAPARHGDDLPFADRGPAAVARRGRHPGRGDRPAGVRDAGRSSSRARR